MSEYMVEVGLDLQADQYVTTMGQALNLTSQYADVASGIPGAVQNLSQSMVKATGAVTGFNKVQSVAVDTAAAYEKQLSNVEARASLTGSSFEKLSKTTKSWARDFPIGMGQATKVMETLQGQGIKSERQLESLGKSFIKLGAATGTSSSAMGKEFIQLTRSMGNSTSQFEKLSDSLVSTTAKIGGSAPSVVAFSKALAPVASTVGLSQTAVTGLSTAMSALGEDGYRAANSFNKVLLDMNRAMRDGGPELKAYSELLGMTQKQMQETFKSNPAEVLAKFTEGVASQGPNASRTLEALGFDSVFTTRSLTALARSGNLRKSIDTAVGSYGDGSTEKAATKAMDGVSDSAEKLRETMGQVVQDVGQPMLGFTKALMMPVQAVASGAQAVTGSAAGQAVLGTAGVGGALMSGFGTLSTGVMGAYIAKMGLDIVQPRIESAKANFRAGQADARAGMDRPGRGGMMSTAGYARAAGQSLMFGPNAMDSRGGVAGGLSRAATRLGTFATEGLARYQHMNNNAMQAAGGPGARMGVTPAIQSSRDAAKTATRDLARSVRAGDFAGVRDAGKGLGSAAAQYGRTWQTTPGAAAGNLARAAAMAPVRVAAGAASLGVRGAALGARALGSLGITPGLAAVGGLAAGGMFLYSQQRKSDEARDYVQGANQDVYMRYNDFAAAIGKAGKGVSAFSESVKATTKTIVDTNTSWRDAFTLTQDEIANALKPGFKPEVDYFGDYKTAESLAFQAQTYLGKNPTMDAVSNMSQTLVAWAGNPEMAKKALSILESNVKSGEGAANPYDINEVLKSLEGNNPMFGVQGISEAQKELNASIVASVGMEAKEAGGIFSGSIEYGDGAGSIDAARASQMLRARELANAFAERQGNTGRTSPGLGQSAQTKQELTLIQSLLSLDDEQARDVGLGVGLLDSNQFATGGFNNYNFDKMLNFDNETGRMLREQFAAIDASGTKIGSQGVQYSEQFLGEMNPRVKESQKYLDSLSNATGVTDGFARAIEDLSNAYFTVPNAAFGLTKMTGDLTAADAMVTGGSREMLAAYQEPSDAVIKQEAVDAQVKKVMSATRGDTFDARMALQFLVAESDPTSTESAVLQQALKQLQGSEAMYQVGMTPTAVAMRQSEAGRVAQTMTPNQSTQPVINSYIQQGQIADAQQLGSFVQMNRAYGAMQANIAGMQRSAGVNIGGIRKQLAMNIRNANEDFETQQQYATEDYETQNRYARQDYRSTKRRAERDYNVGRDRMILGYNIAVERTNEAFDRQTRYAEEDYLEQKKYANEDYEKARLRATRDFNLSVERANRDFQRGQLRAQEDFEKSKSRATEDYNLSRTRMVEDYNKQIARMGEDAAKSMYDPFKRIQAAMVMDAGQLVTNLKDQTGAIDKQLKNLEKVRSMGLDEGAIQSLGLADAQNAQQLNRLVGDLGGNEDLVAQLNEAVAAKGESAAALSTDSGNVQFARMAEDFQLQLERMDKDFKTAQDRSQEDFSVQMSRGLEDFTTQMADAKKDFETSIGDMTADFEQSMVRLDAAYLKSVKRSSEGHEIQLAQMAQDHEINLNQAREDFERQMEDMDKEFQKQMRRAEEEFDKQALRAEKAVQRAIKRMKESAQLSIEQIGASVAASIQSMVEQFVQLNQKSPDKVAAARQTIDQINEMSEKFNIPFEDMGDTIIQEYEAAKAYIEANSGQMYQSHNAYSEPPNQVYTPNPTKMPDHLNQDFAPTLNIAPFNIRDIFTEDPVEVMQDVGVNTAVGFAVGWDEGWSTFKPLAPFTAMLGAIKGFFGINSPSTVFKEVGENVVQGFVNGINTLPGDLWNVLTENIPSAASIKSDVMDAFDRAKTWLKSLGDEDGPINTWIGSAWENITNGIPSISDVMAAVKKAFGIGDGEDVGIVGWLKGLTSTEEGADSVANWIGDAWSKIIENVPGVQTVKNAFSDLGEGIEDVINELIRAWNKLQISIDVPAILRGIPGVPDVSRITLGVNKIDPVDITLAEGGIATRQMHALIGEAGYPEAVIPLNQRGADILAETMARYVSKGDVQGSQMQAYASPVYNYYSSTQDYSTNITGAITVQSQNPDEMAQRLSARAKRARLAQPVGRAL